MSDPAAEELFRALSIQCGFATAADWVAVRGGPPDGPPRPIEERLAERCSIEPADLASLRALVRRSIEWRGGAGRSMSPAPPVDPYATRLPGPPEGGATASHCEPVPDPSGVSSGSDTSEADPYATRIPGAEEAAEEVRAFAAWASSGRFRKVRDHAKGGLGIVYVAVDGELDRQVALKEIQDRHADSDDSRARFLLEAKITGGLEHPGIVPVYGLGHHADGRPYYAMRFIQGDSLREAIAAFHSDPSHRSDPGRRTLALQKLLRRFVDVCNAIAYAHSQGVLHRDLKPENVMVGPYGETLVLDWGLAKSVGRPVAAGESGEPRLPLSGLASGSSNETLPGSIIGTPAYMSPEQAAGNLDRLGPASDVYSLGATLYVLLTGSNAVQADNLSSLLEKVRRGDFPPPRQVDPAVPRPLEAVCLKAMALRPEDRYGSPKDLAAEIEQWTADEPVLAYREPWTARAARWARRHRTLVAALGVLLLTAGVALSVGYVLVRRERDQKEVFFQRAQRTVKDYLVTIANDRQLLDDARSPIRSELLQKAGAYYRMFLAEARDNPALRRESADAYYNLGIVHHNYALSADDKQPDEEAALIWHRKALDLRRELAQAAPDDPATLHELALSEEAVANQERLLPGEGRAEKARTLYTTAIGLLERLAKRAPAGRDDGTRADLARTSHQLGTLLMELGRRDETLGPIRRAIEVQRAVDAVVPGQAVGSPLAFYLADLSEYQRKDDRLREAIATAREALAERERDLKALASNAVSSRQGVESRYQAGLAHCHLGNFLLEDQQLGEAEGQFDLAFGLLDPLVKAYPLRTDFRSVLADVHNGLGETKLIRLQAARSNGDAKKASELGAGAIADYQRHGEISRALEAERPGVGRYHAEVARSDRNIGFARYLLGELATAQQTTQAAIDRLAKLIVSFPDRYEFRSDLGAAWNNLGLIRLAMGRASEAVAAYREAIRHQTIAFERASQYRAFLLTTYANLADAELRRGRVEPAVEALDECRKLAARNPMASVGVAVALAKCAAHVDGPGSRQRIADLAIEALRQGVDAGFDDAPLLNSVQELAPLHDRDDYRRLVKSIESKAAGKEQGAVRP